MGRVVIVWASSHEPMSAMRGAPGGIGTYRASGLFRAGAEIPYVVAARHGQIRLKEGIS